MCNSVMLGLLLITLLFNFTYSIPIESRVLAKRFESNSLSPLTSIKSSLFITAPSGKNALIHFKIKNTSTLFSIGLYQKDFVIMANNDYKLLSLKQDKSAEIQGKSVTINALNVSGGVKYLDKPQWRMVAQDYFNNNNTSLDWNFDKTTQCGCYSILGGQCQISQAQLEKVFHNLPPHSKVRIEALFHFLGNWDSHTGYLKVDNNPEDAKSTSDHANYIWALRCKNNYSSTLKLCGSTPVCKIASPISSTINHTGKNLKLIFGSTLTDSPCVHSYGVSDIKIYIQ